MYTVYLVICTNTQLPPQPGRQVAARQGEEVALERHLYYCMNINNQINVIIYIYIYICVYVFSTNIAIIVCFVVGIRVVSPDMDISVYIEVRLDAAGVGSYQQ